MDPRFSYQQSAVSHQNATPVVIASRKHDLNAIQIYDRLDAEMPNVGLLKVKDAETGKRLWVDTAVRATREAYAAAWHKQQDTLENVYLKTGINHVSVQTGEDFVKALMRLFKQ